MLEDLRLPARRLFAVRVNIDVFYGFLTSLDGRRLFEVAGLPRSGRVVHVYVDQDRRDVVLHVETETALPIEPGTIIPELTGVTIKERSLGAVLADILLTSREHE